MEENSVRDLLVSKGHHVNNSGRDYLIHCLNPEHEDNNPSLRVDQDTGIFNCLSCGFKGNIFKHYNVFTSNVVGRLGMLKKKLASIKQSMNGIEYPLGSIPWKEDFRGISKETLQHFEAFRNTKDPTLENRICLPLKDIRGLTQVYVCRHTLSDAHPKYLNFPRHVNMPLYPSTVPQGYSSLILVEGPFDMLALWDKGIKNVVATLGTNTLNHNMDEKLLPFKTLGIRHIYLMFDGDKPGRVAAKKLKPMIEAHEFVVDIIKIDEGEDPCTLDKQTVDELLKSVED